MWEKEKLLVTSNFSFSHTIFYPFRLENFPPFSSKSKLKFINVEIWTGSKFCPWAGELKSAWRKADFFSFFVLEKAGASANITSQEKTSQFFCLQIYLVETKIFCLFCRKEENPGKLYFLLVEYTKVWRTLFWIVINKLFQYGLVSHNTGLRQAEKK